MRFKEVFASCSAASMLQTTNYGVPTYCMGVLPRYKNKYMKITSMRRKPCIEKNRCLLHSETTTRWNKTPAGATRDLSVSLADVRRPVRRPVTAWQMQLLVRSHVILRGPACNALVSEVVSQCFHRECVRILCCTCFHI